MSTKRSIIIASILIIFCISAAGCSSDGTASDQSRPAPQIELTGLDQDNLYTGNIDQPMVLSFWASWCEYCQEEIPILDSLYEEYGDQVQFITINITHNDSLSGAKSFANKYQLRMPVYLDLDGIASQSFRVLGVPSFVTVDQQGTIVTQRTGAIGEQAEELYREQIEALLSAAQ